MSVAYDPVDFPIPHAKLQERGLIGRALGKDPKYNACATARNKILSGRFSRTEIAEIAAQTGVDVAGAFRKDWLDLLGEILYWLLKDQRLEANEKAFVREYVASFSIEPTELKTQIDVASRRVFLDAAWIATNDNQLTDAEWANLMSLAQRLGLKEASATREYHAVCTQVIDEQLKALLHHQMISDTDWERIQGVAKNLRINFVLTPSRESEVSAPRYRWRVLCGPLRQLPAEGLVLGDSETCYIRAKVEWYENRRVRTTSGSHAPGTSVDRLIKVGTGECVMTSNRIIFRSDTGDTKQIKWSGVIAVSTTEKNVIHIEKASGKSPFIRLISSSYAPLDDIPLLASRLHHGEV